MCVPMHRVATQAEQAEREVALERVHAEREAQWRETERQVQGRVATVARQEVALRQRELVAESKLSHAAQVEGRARRAFLIQSEC